MTRTELFKVLCDGGLRYPRSGRYGWHHSLVGSKLTGSTSTIRIFLGASPPHLRLPR
ncbi:uncharacterized protein G2W53_041121 [Senna tora]|uniref:Uncharacterized protein n=1 Tax=Senna tora TaxID=362788 RepID=A0A834VYY1_9FABA|nr:uncharacterized protein G2W53_041121 [Senna tora]